ncbi:N-acetylglucosaminyltransferase [Dietzia sp. NCCP-2495]|uniref:glycosyltransferase n=1 Tax=Dietzia sp. NCCP-2495 TaxID=2934675 RepID=UPI00222FF19A|nr:glycosyltransferase [Dietzia sp. NCCP-2495]GLB64544.1 N-acetylglucosaminyltransferase [Dietzia sp. NCCP-2495]
MADAVIPAPTPDEQARSDAALHDSVHGLRERDPLASAAVPFVRWQKWVGVVAVVSMVVALVAATDATLIILTALCTVAYLVTLADRVLLLSRGLARDAIMTIPDDRARAVPDSELPRYTVLVPAYNEPEVIGDLIGAMDAIDYPADKLEVLLLLEADDEVTIDAAEAAGLGEVCTILRIPPAQPRTKPKACNYALHYATGEIITIFDAEDRPDPLQLRRVVAALADLDDDVACVQAKLAFHNGSQNMLAAWFTADYALWFNFLLPGLMRSDSPIPLGGTSNHIRADVLSEIGAWDPHNVTEDADLGVRIAARGYRTAVLDSTTLEEANPDPINWIRQRSRWYKGYLQTWLVHMRQPVALWRTLGTVGMFRFTTLLAGTPVIACLNMVFWLVTLSWILGQPALVAQVFPAYVYFPALICLVLGNATILYSNLVAVRETGNSRLWWACLTVPLYWLLMSVAAIKGTYQLFANPSYWEKTVHGLAS